LLSLLTINVRDANDWRVHIYAELWGPKIIALIAMLITAFCLPNDVFLAYNWIALVGAAIFIVIQIIILIDFACEWADSWVTKMEADTSALDGECDCGNFYFVALLVSSCSMLLGTLATVVVLYVFFTQEYAPGGCSASGLNIFFITVQLIMSIVSSVCSVLPAVKERTPDSGLLQASCITIYTSYLVASALLSEPKEWKEGCNQWYTDTAVGSSQSGSSVLPWYHGVSGIERFSAFIGAAITVVAVCYSTFRTSSSTDKLVIADDTADKASVIAKVADEEAGSSSTSSELSTSKGDEKPSTKKTTANKLPFSFSLFHVAFLLGSMYIQQLLTNWESISSRETKSSATAEEITVDSGAGSVWAKIISSWLVFALYIWSLFAPILFPDRDFGYGVSYSF